MAFIFDNNKMYMMPVNFGACGGPRRRPDGRRFIYDKPTELNRYTVALEVENPGQLEALMPDGMILREPYIIIGVDYLSNIAWLGKKQYALMTINIPVSVETDEGILEGQFMSCIWENEVDPIIFGRDQLGFSKIMCEINPPEINGEKTILRVSEYGSVFLRLEIDVGVSPQHLTQFSNSMDQKTGVFHYKFKPKAESPFVQPEINYLTLTPAKYIMPADFSDTNYPKGYVKLGHGKAIWNELTWEQSPCHYNIIKTLSNIQIKRFLGAANMLVYSGNDLFDQRIIKRY